MKQWCMLSCKLCPRHCLVEETEEEGIVIVTTTSVLPKEDRTRDLFSVFRVLWRLVMTYFVDLHILCF